MKIRSLTFFLILVLGGGLAIGFLFTPGSWYADLAKPSFTPPGWIFGPVWTLLYIAIAVCGWRLTQLERDSSTFIRAWWIQLGLNFLWTPVFFGLHLKGVGLLIIVLLFLTIITLIIASWNRDRIVSGLFVPYALWVGFATMLNASIVTLN